MFAYGHHTTADDSVSQSVRRDQEVIHVAITGSSGLIGGELVPFLTTGGHRVARLVGGEASHGQVFWDPSAESFDAPAFLSLCRQVLSRLIRWDCRQSLVEVVQ